MIKIIFFAKYREHFGEASIEVSDKGVINAGELMRYLQLVYAERVNFLADRNLIISINQELAKVSTPVAAGDVVAFYPPVTGG